MNTAFSGMPCHEAIFMRLLAMYKLSLPVNLVTKPSRRFGRLDEAQ